MVGGDSAERGGVRGRGWEGGAGGGLRQMDLLDGQAKGGENVPMWVEPARGRGQWAEPVLVKDVQLCNFVVV